MNDAIATQHVYDTYAENFDKDRNKSLFEKAWLDRFARLIKPGGHILDLGCGSAEPIAAYLISLGYQITGIDASPTMISLAQSKFPDGDWRIGDMRTFGTDQRYDGIIAWNSFFHQTRADQRSTLPRLATLLRPKAPLMFTTGTGDGEALGTVAGQSVYHASLTSQSYTDILRQNDCTAVNVVLEDPTCNQHSVFLAQKD